MAPGFDWPAARASSIDRRGSTATAPWAKAVIMVVEARNTSITMAIPPAVAPDGIRWKMLWQCQCMRFKKYEWIVKPEEIRACDR
jgi:hypothetical protein